MVHVFVDDNIGIIAGVSTALAEMRVSILQINTTKRPNGDNIISLKFACKDTSHLESVISKLRSVPHVKNIVRG